MGSTLLILQDSPGQVGVCGATVRSIEVRANVISHFGLHVLVRHKGLGILLQVKLASLPGNTTEDSQTSSPRTGVIVAGDQRDSTQTAFLQALQEGASMNFMLAQGHRDTQHPTFV